MAAYAIPAGDKGSHVRSLLKSCDVLVRLSPTILNAARAIWMSTIEYANFCREYSARSAQSGERGSCWKNGLNSRKTVWQICVLEYVKGRLQILSENWDPSAVLLEHMAAYAIPAGDKGSHVRSLLKSRDVLVHLSPTIVNATRAMDVDYRICKFLPRICVPRYGCQPSNMQISAPNMRPVIEGHSWSST